MTNDKRIRLISGACTAVVALALLLVLVLGRLSFAATPPEEPFSEIFVAQADEEFMEIIDDYPVSDVDGDEPAQANPEVSDTPSEGVSEGAPSDINVNSDSQAGQVTSTQPSPVQTPRNDGNVDRRAEEDRRRRAEADREVQDIMGGAFSSGGSGSASPNNQSGAGTSSSGTISGSGVGHIGRGWKCPAFGKPKCTSAGTILIEVKIDADGHVISAQNVLEFTFGGIRYTSKSPAGTDAEGIRNAIADVKSRTFTRTGPNDGQGTTAYVVYRYD